VNWAGRPAHTGAAALRQISPHLLRRTPTAVCYPTARRGLGHRACQTLSSGVTRRQTVSDVTWFWWPGPARI